MGGVNGSGSAQDSPRGLGAWWKGQQEARGEGVQMFPRAAAKWSAWALVGAGRSGSRRRGHGERVDREMADRRWGSFHRFVGLAGGREKEVVGEGELSDLGEGAELSGNLHQGLAQLVMA